MERGMRENKAYPYLIALLIALAALLPSGATAQVRASYLYSLSNYDGVVPYNWVRLFADSKAEEIYVADTASRTMKVFNRLGMETYEFLLNDFGIVADFAVDSEGNFLLFGYAKPQAPFTITKCNYRGELISRIEIKNLPKEFASGFSPDTFIYKHDLMYIVDKSAMKAVVADKDGTYRNGYDFNPLIKLDEKQQQYSSGMFGFTVDSAGNMLFTIPTSFSVFVVSPDGKAKSFGTRGSSPGKFNVIAGIATDDEGNIYVTDRLKCVVMVFDQDFNFKTEFGYRGYGPDNLVVPNDLIVDKSGRLYVSQLRDRGVSVFRVAAN